jgi:hypothetical protein
MYGLFLCSSTDVGVLDESGRVVWFRVVNHVRRNRI